VTVSFHRHSVLFSYEISVRFVLSFYEISMMVGFISLQDLSDSRSFSFVLLQFFKDVWLCFLPTASFVFVQDFNDGWFYSFTRSQ